MTSSPSFCVVSHTHTHTPSAPPTVSNPAPSTALARMTHHNNSIIDTCVDGGAFVMVVAVERTVEVLAVLPLGQRVGAGGDLSAQELSVAGEEQLGNQVRVASLEGLDRVAIACTSNHGQHTARQTSKPRGRTSHATTQPWPLPRHDRAVVHHVFLQVLHLA